MQCHYGSSSSNRSTLGPSTEHGVISFRHKGVPYVPFFGLGISYEACIIIGTKFKLYLMWSLPQCVNSVLLLLLLFFFFHLSVFIYLQINKRQRSLNVSNSRILLCKYQSNSLNQGNKENC